MSSPIAAATPPLSPHLMAAAPHGGGPREPQPGHSRSSRSWRRMQREAGPSRAAEVIPQAPPRLLRPLPAGRGKPLGNQSQSSMGWEGF